MDTQLVDVFVAVPPARRLGLRVWIASMAKDLGFRFVAETADMTPYPAIVDHGRWIAKCQNCNGAENVSEDDPVMMCFSCGNEHLSGRLAVVQFPEDRKEAEELLMARPKPMRNWLPHETVDDLRNENRVHGLDRGLG